MKLLRVLVCGCLLGAFVPIAVFADLSDFKNDVTKEESEKEKNKDKDKKKEEPKPDYRTDEQKKADSEFAGFILLLWFGHNLTTSYDDFPYANGRFYRYGDFENSAEVPELRPPHPTRKFYHFVLEGEGSLTENIGLGYRAGFWGKVFPFFGPDISIQTIWDKRDSLTITLAGGRLSFLQVDFLAVDFYLQGAWMSGVLERSGAAFGGVLSIYPFKPLTLRLKIGAQNYINSVIFEDVSFQLGWMVDRFELYGGFHHLGASYAQLDGPVAGLRMHF